MVTPLDAFQLLFFALFGLTQPGDLRIETAQPNWTIILYKIVFGFYMLVTTVVLINMVNTKRRANSIIPIHSWNCIVVYLNLTASSWPWWVILINEFKWVYQLISCRVEAWRDCWMALVILALLKAQSDIEWKFGRAKLVREMHRTEATPSPLNLFTSWFIYFVQLSRKRG